MPKEEARSFRCPGCHRDIKPVNLFLYAKNCPGKDRAAHIENVKYQQLLNKTIAAVKKEGQNEHQSKTISRSHILSTSSTNQSTNSITTGYDTNLICVQSVPSTPEPKKDDIKVEYHPHSERPTRVFAFEEFKRREPPHSRDHRTSSNEVPPWHPFNTRSDFEFSQLALEANFSCAQVEKLISIFKRCNTGQDVLTVASYADIHKRWSESSTKYSQFQEHVVSAEHGEYSENFSFWCLDIWDWALDLVQNRILADEFEWDAQKLYKYDGKEFIRFVDEPWTGDRFHEFQSTLPPTGKPLCFSIFTDKSQLSTFGTQQGYPIITRVANLPVEIRNSQGLGGGCVVGWLPIVDSEPGATKAHVDFKRVVWHKSFSIFLHNLAKIAPLGKWVKDGNGRKLHLFPFIFILSADFEEQVVMSLTRGYSSNFPCPICLVPSHKQHFLLQKFDLRTQVATRALVLQALTCDTITCENMLKMQGLRPVINAFWDIPGFDMHCALSFDQMHNNAHGLGGKHFWPLVQEYLKQSGPETVKLVNARARDLPRWRNLHHFSNLIGLTFSDASKFEDIMKILPFIIHDLLYTSDEPGANLLLQLLRKYINIDTYLALHVHTTTTIKKGKDEVAEFDDLLNEYIIETHKSGKKAKNWDFPKMHMWSHVFDEIMKKGAMRNSTTKPSEQMHRLVRDTYHFRTNFKNIAPQILQTLTWMKTATMMESEIHLDTGSNKEDDELLDKKSCPQFFQIQLGSKQKAATIDSVEVSQISNPDFNHLYEKIANFLDCTLGVAVYHSTKITQWEYLKVSYESEVDWRIEKDYLRCSKMFHGQPRHDHIMYVTDEGLKFGQLKMVFTVVINSEMVPLCLISPFVQQSLTEKEKLLEFIYLQLQNETQIIPARSIIRGAVLFPSYENRRMFILFDVIDSDMFLRVRSNSLISQ